MGYYILLHSGLNQAGQFWLSTILKLKLVEYSFWAFSLTILIDFQKTLEQECLG